MLLEGPGDGDVTEVVNRVAGKGRVEPSRGVVGPGAPRRWRRSQSSICTPATATIDASVIVSAVALDGRCSVMRGLTVVVEGRNTQASSRSRGCCRTRSPAAVGSLLDSSLTVADDERT